MVRAYQTCWDVSSEVREDIKLERSTGWNLARAERSRLCIYLCVHIRLEDQGVKDRRDPITNICDCSTIFVFYIKCEMSRRLCPIPGEDGARSCPRGVKGILEISYPGKWFKHAKAVGKINNEKVTLLFDSGAEISIIDTTFASKIGCVMDESLTQECAGIG